MTPQERLFEIISEEINNVLQEFEEDLGKRAVVLMGLPAAGKSTFVEKLAQKYVPGLQQYKVVNSDNQVKAAQYRTAADHYQSLLDRTKGLAEDREHEVVETFADQTKYRSNQGQIVQHPLTYEWWQQNKDRGLSTFFREFYKPYYANYFDIRDLAKQKSKELFKDKISKAGNILVWDTVASKPVSVLSKMEQFKKNDYTTIIIYLEVEPDLSVVRDEWRGQYGEGRTVGADVINAYAQLMDSAFSTYVKEGRKDDGLIDRLMHFQWDQQGDSPTKGNWRLKKDYRFGVKRKLKRMRQGVPA